MSSNHFADAVTRLNYIFLQKPKENPIKDVIYQESIASGSDSFQEYGPPKVAFELSKQGLPDVVTEQVFAVIEDKVQENVEEKVAVSQTEAIVADSEGKVIKYFHKYWTNVT